MMQTTEYIVCQSTGYLLFYGRGCDNMKKMRGFIEFVKENDRSVHSSFELLFMPGVWAIVWHRIAHGLYGMKLFVFARVINSLSRILTGVDIHPGATIGSPVFIDHATGVVIGEQTIIGNNVVIYHGVTLGARNQSSEAKRHPTIEDDVVLGCNATVLGNITICKGARVKAGSMVTKEVDCKKMKRTKEKLNNKALKNSLVLN